jgi:hypothetical protein
MQLQMLGLYSVERDRKIYRMVSVQGHLKDRSWSAWKYWPNSWLGTFLWESQPQWSVSVTWPRWGFSFDLTIFVSCRKVMKRVTVWKDKEQNLWLNVSRNRVASSAVRAINFHLIGCHQLQVARCLGLGFHHSDEQTQNNVLARSTSFWETE